MSGRCRKVTPVKDFFLFFLASWSSCLPSPPPFICYINLSVYISFPSQSSLDFFIVYVDLAIFLSFRMVGEDEDEGALSDSDGHSGLAADDLASK